VNVFGSKFVPNTSLMLTHLCFHFGTKGVIIKYYMHVLLPSYIQEIENNNIAA